MSTTKKNISQIKEKLQQWGFYILDESEYKNTHNKINLIDTEGYKYFTSYDQIQSNQKINSKLEKVGKVNPYAMENLQLYIKNRGSNTQVVDKQYVNTKHKINLICGCCGEPYQDTYDHIRMKNYVYCQRCGIERRAESHRHDVKDVEERLSKYNLKLLNPNFQSIQCLEVEDEDGYRSSCANLYYIESGKNFVRNHKQNLYTPYNINLYLQKHGIITEVADLTPRHIEVRKDKIGFICSCCGQTFNTTFDMLKRSGRVLCYDCSNNMSNLEYKVKTYLDDNNIKYVQQKRFPQCKNKRSLPFDFYLIDYNYVIEVNGCQHYYENNEYFHANRTLQEQQEIDQYKKQFCIDNNIGYLELPFWLINNPPQTYKNKIDEIIKEH
jgi:very-short-patch-repair endonuclease